MSICSTVLILMQTHNGANPRALLKDTSALQMFAVIQTKRNHRVISDKDRCDWNGSGSVLWLLWSKIHTFNHNPLSEKKVISLALIKIWAGFLQQIHSSIACTKCFYCAQSSAWAVVNNYFIHWGTWQLSVPPGWRGPDMVEYWCKEAPVDGGEIEQLGLPSISECDLLTSGVNTVAFDQSQPRGVPLLTLTSEALHKTGT